ncbi:uncharacterized protein HO173_012361 [Neofusicoccum parvum]|uniref:Uncharacterized protein HO173_012361 n=1 Tax=Neofusicoccum parvum TaxID=310453 RepID=A0ACB5S2N7_9PEZI|nr:uncharacterized protein HO173_012361 [Neofusicoccum parvum]
MASPNNLPNNSAAIMLSRFSITIQDLTSTIPFDTTRCFTDATISDLQKYASTICDICQDRFGGLSAEDIRRISPDEAANIDGDPHVCARPSKLACGHVFGRECLKRWLDTSNTCPICRDEVSSMRGDDADDADADEDGEDHDLERNEGLEDHEIESNEVYEAHDLPQSNEDFEIYDIESNEEYDDHDSESSENYEDQDRDLESNESFWSGYLLTPEDELDSDAEERSSMHFSAGEDTDEEGDAEEVGVEISVCVWLEHGQTLPPMTIMFEFRGLEEEAALPEEDQDQECTCNWFFDDQGMPMREEWCESCVLAFW